LSGAWLAGAGPVGGRNEPTHDQIANLFHLRRDHVTASEYRAARARAFDAWADISGVAAAT
jgi:hypothetical protein